MRSKPRGFIARALTLCLVSILISAGFGADATAQGTPPSKPRSAIDEHKERVTALQKVAVDLRKRCESNEDLEKDQETVEARVLGRLGAEIAALDTKISSLTKAIADAKNDGDKAAATIEKNKAEVTKKSTEAQIKNITESRRLQAELRKQNEAIDKAEEVLKDKQKTDTEKKTATDEKDKAIDARKTAEEQLRALNEPVQTAFALFRRGRQGICDELCPAMSVPTMDQPINFCAFSGDVPATAAVIADWRSVDALIEYIGVPRRRLEAAFGPSLKLEVQELPSDPYAKHRPSLPPAPRALVAQVQPSTDRLPDDCRGRMDRGKQAAALAAPVAAATGLAGIDLTSASVQTAEVALAALAKVIEDRAKREVLVWFLERMNEEVCGKEEDEKECLQTRTIQETEAIEKAQKAVEAAHAALARMDTAMTDADTALTAACLKGRESKLDGTAFASSVEAPKRALQKAALDWENKRKALDAAKKALAAARAEAPAACKDKAAVLREVRTYWLPTTCALAKERDDYVQYGGGGNLMRALQGAVATDVRSWPGAAAGVGAGASFWATSTHAPYKSDIARAFQCAPTGGSAHEDPLCRPTVQLRRATARMVGQIQGGANPLASLYLYGTAIDELNDAGSEKLHNTPFQMAACVSSLPHVFQTYEGRAAETTDDQKAKVHALLLAGLASAPPCWTVVGEGWDRGQCKAFSAGSDERKACEEGAQPKKAISRNAAIERLTTILRWHAFTSVTTERVVAQWGVVKTSWESFFAAVEALKKSGGGAPFTPPPFDPSTVNDARTFAEVLKAFDTYVKDATRAAQQTEQVRLLQASATLARASLDFGVALTGGLSNALDETLYPGLRQSAIAGQPFDTTKMKEALESTSKRLAGYSQYVATTESALGQDWGAVVARIVQIVREELREACEKDKPCNRLVDRLSRYSGLFSSLVSEKDPEKVAQALDAAAMPIGGWRHKQLEGSKTISIAAFPGLGTGGEWRWGQYGVVRESGRDTYWAPPTLQLPVGLDFAYGTGCEAFPTLGLFVSVLDPAGYLHYDPDKRGRLTGAQLLTALSPGAGFRVSLGNSPLGLMAWWMVRPNFRAWESDVAAPGATAMQVLGSLTVDVTLFELWAKRRD